jgi:phosphate transport system substrate-binding protein
VVVSVSGGGSGVGISGIIDGTVDIANCSREMHASELARAAANGHHPVQHKVGYDGIAIYVHKDNPLAAISIAQLREVFGEGGKITKWSQLGVTMPAGTTDDIVLVSRQNNSGTYEYFKEHVLGGANMRLGTRDQNSSKDVVELVSSVPAAIGYSGLAYATPAVRTLPVRMKDDSAPVVPSVDSVLDSTYPIARPLFMYTQGEPTRAGQDALPAAAQAVIGAGVARTRARHGFRRTDRGCFRPPEPAAPWSRTTA